MKKILIYLICCIWFMSGCSSNRNNNDGESNSTNNIADESVIPQLEDNESKERIATNTEEIKKPIKEIDLTNYFQGIEGCAVIFDEVNSEYLINNLELSEKRTSPCSTFKIVSTLIGFISQVLEDENTMISWNGTHYLVDEWNQDLTLKPAFKSSCIWYYREIIDKSGKELVEQTLSDLSYGNCDISQWAGSNVNAGYDELNGFWLESSLLITPKEQVDTMIRLFSHNTKTYEDFLPILKDIMLVENNVNNISIYGKTGTGSKHAWFVGFAEKGNSIYYYAVLLDDLSGDNISGQKAKEIAINIVEDYLQ